MWRPPSPGLATTWLRKRRAGQRSRATAPSRRLRGHGIDTTGIQRRGERMGLYFVTSGAGMRATEVIYDRAHSSFAEAPANAWDWDTLLAGVDRLHLSGITPALGPVPAQAAIAAAEAAAARGIAVSFDGNWRGKLWERWDGKPREILSRIVAHADLMFGNHRDIALAARQAVFGRWRGPPARGRRRRVRRLPQAPDDRLDRAPCRGCRPPPPVGADRCARRPRPDRRDHARRDRRPDRRGRRLRGGRAPCAALGRRASTTPRAPASR